MVRLSTFITAVAITSANVDAFQSPATAFGPSSSGGKNGARIGRVSSSSTAAVGRSNIGAAMRSPTSSKRRRVPTLAQMAGAGGAGEETSASDVEAAHSSTSSAAPGQEQQQEEKSFNPLQMLGNAITAAENMILGDDEAANSSSSSSSQRREPASIPWLQAIKGPDGCETSWDCDAPLTCCDYVAFKICCNQGGGREPAYALNKQRSVYNNPIYDV